MFLNYLNTLYMYLNYLFIIFIYANTLYMYLNYLFIIFIYVFKLFIYQGYVSFTLITSAFLFAPLESILVNSYVSE